MNPSTSADDIRTRLANMRRVQTLRVNQAVPSKLTEIGESKVSEPMDDVPEVSLDSSHSSSTLQ